MRLDNAEELIKQRNLLTKEIDDLSKPVYALCMKGVCTTYYIIEKSKVDEDQVKKVIKARNTLTKKINELGSNNSYLPFNVNCV